MGTSSISLSIFSVILLLSVLWTPALSDDKCDLSCKRSSSGASFLNGHTYNYAVDGTVRVYLTGGDKQETTVKIFGQVAVTAYGNCELSLKVNSLAISGPDGKKYPAPKGIEKVVRFNLEDGRVGPEICSEDGDTRWSLNVKRAIISLLQTEQKPSTQTDVFGACPTEVSSSQEGGAVLIHRTRDLSRCAHREQTRNELITAVYNPTAEIKNTQLLQSILNVETKVNNGVPEKIAAVEQYLYRPFSVGENGARAEVNTKLSLSGTTKGNGAGGHCTVPRSIIFDNPHDGSAKYSSPQNVLTAVKEASKTLTTEASSKSAGTFAQVVRIFRTANKEDLLKVFGQVKGNNLEKRVYLDALLRAGTGYSIEASIQILKSKELNTIEEKVVFLSLGNARHVTSEAVKAAASLLDLPNLPKGVYLGVGALAGTYCRDHNCHSDKSDGVVALSNKLGAKLQNCKPKSKLEEDNVVAVLKGIRNIGHLENNLVDKVVHCAVDNNVKARLRVAALEAFQADSCATKIKKTALDIMKNRQLDSEIRIKAYLAVIDCPCGKSANEIKTLLDSEPVHQVGRFISTSLRAIRASANPDKQHARQHYGLIGIPNKYNVDDRKYSFYREMSYNVDAVGVGGNVEESVIYSQDSFLPRSVSLNLTAEVFGHNVNILEVGGRQGNLDRVVEHFLGPKGVFRTKDPQEMFDELKTKLGESVHKAEKSVRGRRSIKSEVDNFDRQVKEEAAPYNNELDLDVYIKLFGTDAVFLSFGDGKGFDANGFLDESLKMVNEGMNKMKHFQQELRGHLLFLDAELAYPTSTGLPLKLDAVGAATGRVDVSSSIDIRQCLKNPESAKVDIKLIPSTDVEVSLMMLVDAGAVATGLKVMTNLHSSTGSHVVAKVIENGHGIDLQWGLPLDKQEILTASSDMVFFTTEKGQLEKQKPISAATEKNEYSGCFDQLSQVLGLTLCGKVSLPFSFSGPKSQNSISQYLAHYPLVGSTKVNLVLEKNDLRGYHLKGVVRSDSNGGRYGIELLFDAEGSKNRRTQVIADFINNQEEKTIKASLESPIKTLSGQVSIYTKSNEYALLLKAKMDEASYYGRVGLNIEGNDRRHVYKPVLEYQVPNSPKKNINVDGQIVEEKSGGGVKYTVSGVKFTLPETNEPVTLMGHFSREPRKLDMDLKLMRGQHSILLSSSLANYDFKADFQNTLNPYINFKVNGHFENGGDVYHNDIDLYYSEDCRNPQNRVTFNQLYKRHYVSSAEFTVITKNKFEIHALPFTLKYDMEVDPKKIDLDVGGVYMDKKASIELDGRTHIKKEGDYKVKWVVNINNQEVEGFYKRDIVSAEKSNLENYIDFKKLGKYELSGVVLHRMKANDVNVGVIGHFKISGTGKDSDLKFDIGYIETAKLYSSHATITSSNKGELLNYLLKINTGANTNGQLKFNLKDAITANGQFQVTDSDGKGNGNIMVHFKPIDRVIKGEVKFVVKDPTYNADVDLYLNFGKSNNDKIHFSTATKKTDKLFDSKNKFAYGGKNAELNLNGEYHTLGKNHGSVEVVLPDERCLSLKVDRDFAEKDNVINGHAEVVLSDASKRGGPASTIVYKSKVTNTNWEKETIDLEGQIEMQINGGKNLLNTFSYKNIPKGKNSDVAFKNEISGTMLPKKGILDASATYTEGDSMDDTYRVKAFYGDDLGMELVGVFQAAFPDKGLKKYVDDYTMNIRLPFEKAHDIKWISKLVYNQPENQAVEITLIESVQVNADLYKFESNGKYDIKNGNTKLKIILPHVDPVNIDASYKVDDTKEKRSGAVDVQAHYGKGKTTSISVQGSSGQKELDLSFSANSPQNEKFKKFEMKFNTKNPSPDTFNSLVLIDADGRVYKSEGLVVYSASQPIFDLKYSSPASPKPSRLYFKGIAPKSNQGRMEFKIENCKNFDLDSSFEISFEKDLILKFHANAETLGLKNYNVDISSKDAGNGKRLEFNAINDNKNIISGSTSYISKQEGPKTIIEGSGNLKVKDEQKPANFKYIRTILTEGNEQGVETFVNVAYGDRNHVAEFRVTNLEYKTSYVYCEEKKQCAHAEINAKLVTTKLGSLQHQFNAGFDLRKLGLATEFGLQVSNEFSDKNFPQYDMNLHVNRESKKYHFHVYSQPEFGKFPAGIVLTFPQRVIALESLVHYPTNKNLPFPVRGEISLYPDKNKPQSKTAVRFTFDVSGNEKQGEASALVGFSHPRIGKEALITFRGALNRPNDNTVRIETRGVISHSCLGHDREAKFLMEVNPVHIKLLVDTPLVKVIDLEGSATAKENLQQVDFGFSLLEGKPVTIYAVAKDFQYYEFTTGYKDESERKLSVIANLNPEKRVDVSVDIVLNKNKKNIVNGAIFIEDNLVKSEYGLSKDNFNYFVSALRKDLGVLQERVKEIGEKANDDVKKTLQRVEPTYRQLEQAYREDMEKLTQDIANDKTLKEISEALHVVTKVIAKLIDDVITVFKPMADKFAETVTVFSKKVAEMYEKQIAPGLKQLYTNVAAVIQAYFDGIIDAAAHFTAIIMDFFEKHKPELQELTNIFTEIFKDITRIVVAQLKEWRAKSSQFISDMFEQIKEMPIIALIKEKWQELAVPEQFLGIMNDAYHTVREVMPTEEAKTFLDVLRNYAQKKLRQEKFDEQKELRIVYEKMIAAVSSLVAFVRQAAGQYGITYPTFTYGSFPGFSPVSMPSFKGSAGWSLLSQIIQGDIPNPWVQFRTYRPRSLNPLDEVPTKMRGVIINGQHIFTFDGRHLTFPGTCRYVLAHDHIDRNFTLISQLQNGHPKAIILEDKSGITIELKENGQVALNGANHGYPVIEEDVFAFREPKGRIGLGSRYGLMVFCTSKLEVCYVEISGFYHGKLRGLLGDGNNEPYDDFRIPNGKIVNTESEFGNAYKLAGSCKPVQTPAHDHHQMHMALPAACETVFGGTSPLRPLALLMDNSPFRQACIHACGDNSPKSIQEACDLGRGYATLAQTGLLPAVLPSHCLKCTDADKPREIGDIYDIKVPTKQADIIVTVEVTESTEKMYKDIIVPLVGQVIDGLKSKRVTDVKVYLVGITSRFPYPILYDTDLKLKSAKVQFTDKSRYNELKSVTVGDERVDKYAELFANVVKNFRLTFGIHNVMFAYDSVFDLPLRAGAVKHLISAIGDSCHRQDVFASSLRSVVYSGFFKNLGLSYSLIKNTPDLKIGGGKNVNQVVGFSKHGVLLLGDKKQKETETLRNTLHLETYDDCVDFSQDTDGYTFSASTFQACNPGQQKQYLQTAAASVVNRLLQENLVQACTCSYVDVYRARSVCVVKERKEAARRRK
ncbi:apolipophorins [Bicyclus anynana]|uniref:Apolipophorins n=1 Tax=Bicyclus anynana TaxID=110368 RepID=A0A6J1NSP6_BICAN|nr:apolipophorins [Bicyclus anynana]